MKERISKLELSIILIIGGILIFGEQVFNGGSIFLKAFAFLIFTFIVLIFNRLDRLLELKINEEIKLKQSKGGKE